MIFGPIAGVSLRAWVRAHGAARWQVVQQWMTAIVRCLGLAHARGFAHHDLRPDVVFVEPSLGVTQLLGFGRSQVIGGDPSTIQEAGTPPAFWAPELFMSDEVDLRSDLFGAAALGYFALTGKPPIQVNPRDGMAANLDVLMSCAIEPIHTLVRDINPQFAEVVMRALAREPSDRFQSAGSMLAALEGLGGVTLPISRDVDAPKLSIGEVIDGRYKIRARLGSGGMSRVFLAEDLSEGESVALKLLRSRLETSHGDVVREAKALSAVSHPNVVDVRAVGSFRSTPYLALEHIPGRSVSEAIQRWSGRLPTWLACSIVDQVGRGLSAVHAADLVHGDIKPSNVIVGGTGLATIVDFGLVRTPSGFTEGRFAATPAYVAPERVRSEIEPELAARMDVYSLGVMAYELLTGVRPFRQATPDELMAAHVWSAPTPPSTHDRSLQWADAVILRALAKDPRSRTVSARAFAKQLIDAALNSVKDRAAWVLVATEDENAAVQTLEAVRDLLPSAQIVRVRDGVDACQFLSEHPWDAVFLDLHLPRMNGFEVAAHARATLREPPSFGGFSRRDTKPDLQLLSSVGFRAFAQMPVETPRIGVMLMRLLEAAMPSEVRGDGGA